MLAGTQGLDPPCRAGVKHPTGLGLAWIAQLGGSVERRNFDFTAQPRRWQTKSAFAVQVHMPSYRILQLIWPDGYGLPARYWYGLA